MRLDLTHASYRVLRRAAQQSLPIPSSEISAAGLLLALFQEEECRAADWLAEGGLTPDAFCAAFGLAPSVSVLHSPISAPSFPMGDYGVPPNPSQGAGRAGAIGIEASPADDNPPPVRNPDPEPRTPPEEPESEPEAPQRPKPPPEPDQWIDSARESDAGSKRRTYSIYQPGPYESNRQSRAKFYLDDQPVPLGRMTRSLESAFELLSNQFGKRKKEDFRRIPAAGGGIATILSRNADFLPAANPLATEHLLAAVVLDEGDVGRWLHDNGFEPDSLFRRIESLDAGRDAAFSFEPDKPVGSANGDPLETEDAAATSPESGETATLPAGDSADPSPEKVYRLLDAAANRAREALRVLEDYARFFLDDFERTRQLKDFRHELRAILESVSLSQRLSARNTENDVGTEVESDGEFRRCDIRDVLSANFSRLQESLRSLEEFSKLEHPETARRLERLRYRSYMLHKEIVQAVRERPDSDDLALPRHRLLEQARLYALIDVRENDEAFTELVDAFVEGGVGIIQLRDKSADDRTLLARSRILRRRIEAQTPKTLFIMNDRPDLAVLADADGVHVGQEEIPVSEARKIVGPERLIGVSTHDIEQARQAVADGADYIGVGPVFESSTKAFDHIPGLDLLKEIAAEITLPAFAIGGITAENLPDVLASGVRRVAVGSALTNDSDPVASARKLAERLEDDDPAS